MLCYKKIIELLYTAIPTLKYDPIKSLQWLNKVIIELEQDKTFFEFLRKSNYYPILIEQSLLKTHDLTEYSKPYIAIGIDGSQIYPDRHYGISCFLVNIGTILLEYQNKHPLIVRQSEPFLFTEWNTFNDSVHTHDIVDTNRFLLEFKEGLKIAKQYQNISNIPIIVFIDGPLTFWHLFDKPQTFQNHFFSEYINILKEYEQKKILLVGYISKPRSKELMNIVKMYLSYKNNLEQNIEHIQQLIDSHLLSLFLKPNQKTIFFQNNEHMSSCYIHADTEYVKIEMPLWIMQNKEQSNIVLSAVLHQIINGFGYPTVLSLAHEQAIIKEADRHMFIKTLHNIMNKQGIKLTYTEKNMKKMVSR